MHDQVYVRPSLCQARLANRVDKKIAKKTGGPLYGQLHRQIDGVDDTEEGAVHMGWCTFGYQMLDTPSWGASRGVWEV